MSENLHSASPHRRSDVRHNALEINLHGVLVSAGCIVAMVALVLPVIEWTILHFRAKEDLLDKVALGKGVLPYIALSRPSFPEPREQSAPEADLRALLSRENAQLNSYGWAEKKSGVVRIPITRAMELISQRALLDSNSTSVETPGRSILELQQQRPLQTNPPGTSQ